jgi:hypothetical protein
MESESLLPLERMALEDVLEPRTSFLDLIVVLTSKMFCRMKLKGWLSPRQERQIKLKMRPRRQRNPDRTTATELTQRRKEAKAQRIRLDQHIASPANRSRQHFPFGFPTLCVFAPLRHCVKHWFKNATT